MPVDEDDLQPIQVLLVEDDPGDTVLIEEMLGEIQGTKYIPRHVDRVAKALSLLNAENFGVILLDLSLPDGQGLDVVRTVRAAAPDTPVVVLSGLRDEDVAVAVVKEGVQDYCVKGHVDSFLLGRSLRYAIERKRIEDDLRRTRDDLAVLFQISSIISRSVDTEHLLADIVETITGLKRLKLAPKASVFFVEGDRLKLSYDIGHDRDFFKSHQQLKVGECLCGIAAAQGKMILTGDADMIECHSICYAGMPSSHGHIIIPLTVKEQVTGVLCLYPESATTRYEGKRSILRSLGEQIGIAVETTRLYEETKRLSLHDPLTGLANRRHLDIVAENNLAMARRHGTPFSIILLDLDHFKRYNDTYGHTAGDSLLIEVANTMTREIRETNLVVRYGGEEFLILLPDTRLNAALTVAERTRRKIQEHTGITVSLGVSCVQSGTITMAELIGAADTALYRAKKAGRNCVMPAVP